MGFWAPNLRSPVSFACDFTFIFLLEKKFVRDTHGWEETLGTLVSVLFCWNHVV